MNADLSEFHAPVTQLFGGSGELRAITNEERCFFDDHGYLAGLRMLTAPQIDALRSDLAELMTPEYASDKRFYEYHHNESSDPSRTLFHALGAWRISPAFHDLLFLKPLVDAASRLLDGPVRFWHDQLFVKPANEGGVVAWHQDYSYWTRTKPMAHLTCWIALDDSTVENGCVHYVPGSHRWPLLPRGSLADEMEGILNVFDGKQRADFKPVPIVLKAGEASFHHPMMLHGSYENRSSRPRRATVINVFRDGVRSDSDEPLLEGVPVVPRGETIDGRFFPMLS